MTKPRYLLSTPRVCILTGAPGEDPDDCTTHDHEEDENGNVMTDRRIQFTTPYRSEPVVINGDDETINYQCYDMIDALHNPDTEIASITINYDGGEWECYTAAPFEEEENDDDLAWGDNPLQDFVDSATDAIDSFFKLIRSRMNL